MSLRTRILLFLFVFALVPLLMAVVINLPLVLERVDAFYRQTTLRDLRQDFRDLDQHLASRDANVRLLARLPEPSLLARRQRSSQARVELDRARYTEWVNRILRDEQDITEIRFLDEHGEERFWLARESRTHYWYAPPKPLPPLPEKSLAAIRSGELKDVAYSPVQVRLDARDPQRIITLQMMAPIRFEKRYRGAVVITVDISGMVRRDPKTVWALDDGSYLNLPGMPERRGNAFDDYPGLREVFAGHKPALWEQGQARMIWVPMFITESARPLWVGRHTDVSQLLAFRNELVRRVLAIVFGLILLLLIAARMLAKRVEQISSELIEGIHRTLAGSEAVTFSWKDTRELEQLSADLSRLSENHAVQAARLRQHTRELEQSNRYKSEFLANVSHELRTPLNSILLLSKMLADESAGLSPERREQARVIHKAGTDLKALIDNILDLSKIEAGRFDVHCEAMPLKPLLEDLRELLQPQFDDRGLSLGLELAPGLPGTIHSDPDKVRQILKNFLANALKFTHQGGVRILARPAPAPYAVELAVSDTGIGIPRDKQAHIFEAFRQADGSTSRRYGGTGLGLTISRQLARLLRGDIRLRSEPGQGATFSLLLPDECDGGSPPEVPPEVQPAEAGPPGTEDPGSASAPSLVGARVMLLSADVRTQLRLSQVFQRWGCQPLLACDLDEARETLEELERIDILVFDPQILGERPCATIESLMDDHDGALLVGLGDAPRDVCDSEVCWLADAPLDEAGLERVVNDWSASRGSE